MLFGTQIELNFKNIVASYVRTYVVIEAGNSLVFTNNSVITISDLGYNEKNNHLYVKEFQLEETMTVVKSTPNFTEVALNPVSTRSNVTGTMANPIMDAFRILFGQQ
ncbi:MAG TPA: hypothetical protein VH481_10590 [Nitrososphaeraceae archaeon]|jgi:hypothetical protein